MPTELPKWDRGRFDVAADAPLLQTLTEDMKNCSNALQVPASWWMLPQRLVNGSMADMMAAWCGDVGQLPLSDLGQIAKVSGDPDLVASNESYLRMVDHRRMLEGVTLGDLGKANWRFMDLGSLMDYLLVSAFCDFSQERLRVLEIGGGFGRLGEFFAFAGGPHMQYVNIDAVPISLMYCYQYLRQRFPERKVIMFSPDQALAGDFDFLVVPSWHIDKLALSAFDLGINVESMQEMSQELVDYYLGFLDKSVRNDGVIYLVNSREYKFRGTWRIPENWEYLFRHRTPRSWTVDHPAEVFRKRNCSQAGPNMLRSAAFELELATHRELANLRKRPRWT